MNRIIEIIKYTWKAKGRHGIHSPFVYDLIDKCFRKPISSQDISKIHQETGIPKKVIRCMLQLLDHLHISHVYTNHLLLQEQTKGSNPIIQAHAIERISESALTGAVIPVSIIFIDFKLHEDSLTDSVIQLLDMMPEESLILFGGIRQQDSSFVQWQQLISNPNIHLSADLYHFGILSKRSFQEKEHFVLRY